jgi:uncharacterized protein (DUF849 family)
MSRKIMITCAVTGSQPSFNKHPGIPITPEQIANSAIEAGRAGASMVHIHVRNIETGIATGETHLYREVVERIADSGVDAIINLTTGFGARFVPSAENPRVASEDSNLLPPEDRVAHILELRPEVCSLDVGTLNFGEQVFMNTPDHLATMARKIMAAGSKPEIEVFEIGHIRLARAMLDQGLLESPPHFQLCLGIKWAMPATIEAMKFMRDQLPEGSTWAAFGISQFQFPMAEAAVELGGHVRVGLEDNLYLERGVFAPSNASLVAKAVEQIEAGGNQIATPSEARAMLSLPPKGQGNSD